MVDKMLSLPPVTMTERAFGCSGWPGRTAKTEVPSVNALLK